MPGLDPGIHAVPPALNSTIRANGSPWMAGSCPAMTVFGDVPVPYLQYWCVVGLRRASMSSTRLRKPSSKACGWGMIQKVPSAMAA
jgi:hypothetical protein